MATKGYRIRIRDMVGLSPNRHKAIGHELFTFFLEVTDEASKGNTDYIVPIISWNPGVLENNELQLFLVESHDKSIVNKHFPGTSLGPGGTTKTGAGLSEVYMDAWGQESPGCIAKIIFHELMHNKLKMGNEMHSDPNIGFGLAGSPNSTGCSAAPWDPFRLTAGNIRAMASALLNPAPQWMGKP